MTKLLYANIKHIVPFMFETKAKENFNQLVEKIQSKQEWNIQDMCGSVIERDLYSTILDSFVMDKKENNIGCSFAYNLEIGQEKPLSFNYSRFEKDFVVSFNRVELFLFRTGVGFLWYEINMPEDMTVDELILFQNEFKELSYKRFVNLDRWTNRYTFELEPERLQPFLMGHWIDELLAQIPFKYQYFAERKDPLNNDHMIADKAIIYDYAIFDELGEDFWENTYRITNGYNQKYIIKKGIEKEYIEFFHQAYCYASTGGTGYYVVPTKENRGFYTGIFKGKVAQDYFLLNILALYQSYTLLKFTKSMESELSAESKKYLTDAESILTSLQKIETEINVFLIKSIYSSVSHIEHQNEYYDYLIKRRKVKENIDGLTIGLASLQKLQAIRKAERLEEIECQENLEREISDDRLNIGLGLLSILAVTSAIADGYGAVEIIKTWFALSRQVEIIIIIALMAIVLLIGGIAIASIVPSICRARKKRKER